MIPEAEIWALIVLVAVLVYWFSAARAKELARTEGRSYCQARDLTFLDDTVVLKRIGLARNTSNRVMIRRLFQFEFSSDGALRYKGDISLLGNRVENIHIDAYRVAE